MKRILLNENITYHNMHDREEVSFQTSDVEMLYSYLKRGWSFKTIKEGFIVRAPEEWLVDLSDPYKISFYGNLETNLAYYMYLKQLLRENKLESYVKDIIKKYKIKNFDFYILKGNSLEIEIRIAGYDKRVKLLKNYLFENIKLEEDWNTYLNAAINLIGCNQKIKLKKVSIHNAEKVTKKLFNTLRKYYGPFNAFNKKVFNKEYFKDMFVDFPSADVYIFIPWGCFQYVSSFVNKENFPKIMFWEYHADKDRIHMNKFMSKSLKDKKVCVIDNSYTGSTINVISEKVKVEGGNPFRVALFPKSKRAINNCEYCYFIDKIIESKNIDTSDPNWPINTFVKVVNDKFNY